MVVQNATRLPLLSNRPEGGADVIHQDLKASKMINKSSMSRHGNGYISRPGALSVDKETVDALRTDFPMKHMEVNSLCLKRH